MFLQRRIEIKQNQKHHGTTAMSLKIPTVLQCSEYSGWPSRTRENMLTKQQSDKQNLSPSQEIGLHKHLRQHSFLNFHEDKRERKGSILQNIVLIKELVSRVSTSLSGLPYKAHMEPPCQTKQVHKNLSCTLKVTQTHSPTT